MSNRSQIAAHRKAVQDFDEPLRVLEIAVASRTARARIAKARAMLRAADQLLGQALTERLDSEAGEFVS